jgi:serine/threonine protein kinase
VNTVFHKLGPYEVINEIGRGGMATVVLATDTRTGQNVALKLVPVAPGDEARAILQAEQAGAELQRQFSQVNSHVPAVYEHRANESGYFLVAMEYLDGENLSDVIVRGPVPADRAVSITIELLSFLEAAHNFEAVIDGRKLRSLVHGDLKPQNVRITSNGKVKVLDFGIAKALSLSRKVTRNDFGTRPYLSPERLDGDGDVNEFADLWAVGVMLYEMIRGARPYDAPDTQRLERLIRSRRPPQPLTGLCPAGLEAIVARLLGPTTDVRYENARAIRDDLERFRVGVRTSAEEHGWPALSTLEGPARVFDDEATRRTTDTNETTPADDEKTRRTRPAVVPPPLPTIATAPAMEKATSRKGRDIAKPTRRVPILFRAALVGLSIWVFAMFANEFSLMGEAKRVAADVSTRELDQLAEVFAAQRRLAQRSSLRFGTIGLERELTERTEELTDSIIANYRMALPTVREAQWMSARDALRRAIPIAPGNRRLRAALRYSEGHLHRIDGEASKARQRDEDAQREFSDAVASFREAAELRPDWPDPFLGLARVFIYGLDNVERGADAIDQAQRRGYTLAEREISLLADGYRTLGNSLVRNARRLAGMAQESDYLTRAAEAYQRALNLYTQSTTTPNVTENIRGTQRAHDQAQQRLAEITPFVPAPEPPPDPEPPAPAESSTPSSESEPRGSQSGDLEPWA